MPDSQANGETERGSGYHNRDGSHFRHVEYRSDLNIKFPSWEHIINPGN